MNIPSSHYEDRVEELPFRKSNLVFIFNPQGQVLLYKKVTTQNQFDASLQRRNGLGGKLDPAKDRTNEESAVRESQDEGKVDITTDDLQKVGTIRFYFRTKTKHNQECDIYFVTNYTRPYGESDEMRDPKWYDSDKLPEDEMRPSDKIRVPKIIEGGNILAVVYHEDDGKLIEYIPVQSFDEVDHEYFNKH